MRKDMIYDLRILFLESYVRITMIGYESKMKKSTEKFGDNGSSSRHPPGRS